jgi:hypothetical protein
MAADSSIVFAYVIGRFSPLFTRILAKLIGVKVLLAQEKVHFARDWSTTTMSSTCQLETYSEAQLQANIQILTLSNMCEQGLYYQSRSSAVSWKR